MKLVFILIAVMVLSKPVFSQKNRQAKKTNLVFVDKNGVMRWTASGEEAAFFGTNYTVPFAYGYRSHKALGADLEKAIRNDVYHLSRLGFDAFRVHVWDTEITDTSGNLLENEHLRLFDFLVAELKKRKIKTFLTPLAFWGNGYPEPNEPTPGFSAIYNKQSVLVTENAIRAQENYLKQILKHLNPFTGLSYTDDPDVIALEINNEPNHSGTRQVAARYIDRMVKAVKNSGWTKPVFYNISQSPWYADVVSGAAIEGVSFQWYPTGLVANRSLRGNFLPHVDAYRIPFGDTIPGYRHKARMVYEFDAADVPEAYLYPAMARSFRTAGFQWATQFAYDPLLTAYANTEYQTHYVNLAYTPAKAISLLIASKVFHQIPRLKHYGVYPADTLFDVFRVSYTELLSEMNSEEEFYYSGSTQTKPVNTAALKHIAGTGNSPVVRYEGTGAYFLDKINGGTWRLEVMPDAVLIRDPFERASPKKEVSTIIWSEQLMKISLPDLGPVFKVIPVSEGNDHRPEVKNASFSIRPGTYLLFAANKEPPALPGNISFEFAAPAASGSAPSVFHEPVKEMTAGNSLAVSAVITGADTDSEIIVEFRHSANRRKTTRMHKTGTYHYSATLPEEMMVPGILNYRIIIQRREKDFFVFPGNHAGNPYAWDNYINETWETRIVPAGTALEIFDPADDREKIMIYHSDRGNNQVHYITGNEPRKVFLKAVMSQPGHGKLSGWQFYFRDKMKGRKNELQNFSKLVFAGRAYSPKPVTVTISLINEWAQAFAASVTLQNELKDFEIPFDRFRQDSCLLLPRPYPGFLPLWFKSSHTAAFDITNMEKIEIRFGEGITEGNPAAIEIGTVQLKK